MSTTSTASPATTSNTGRQADGRFAKGNHLGTGNPFARQVAALHTALIETVTPQDIKEIAYILLLNAKGGDLGSIKLLFQYVIGKPQAAVDPDTLDRDEMKAFQQDSLQTEQMDALRSGTPASAILPYQRLFVEAQEKQIGEACLEQLREWEQEHAADEQAIASPEEAARPTEQNGMAPAGKSKPAANKPPSTDGFDGDRSKPAPSANGHNGGATAALIRWLRGQPTVPNGDSGPK